MKDNSYILYQQMMVMMVQGDLCRLMEIFDQDLRRRLLLYLNASRRVTYRSLNVSPSLLNKMKKGERRISDKTLLKLLSKLSVYEFMCFEWFVGGRAGIRTQDLRRVRASVDDGFVQKVRRAFSSAINEKVVQRELELFENYLRMLGRSPRTIRDRLIYLRKFLCSGCTLNSEDVINFVSSLHGESKVHMIKTLKLYFKLKRRRDLAELLKVPRPQPSATYCPSLGEVRDIADAIDDIQAKVYFVLLAESGLRPGEVFNLKLNNIDLNVRVSELSTFGLSVQSRAVAPLMLSRTKRAFCSFYTSKSLIVDYVEDKHIGCNERVFYNRRKLRKQIYTAMLKELGKTFELYALRRFFVTELLRRNVNPLYINMMQGRCPRTFREMLGHYQKLTLKDLRREYDKANLKVT